MDKPQFSLPLYDSLGKDKEGRLDELFLTSDQLVEQLHLLMVDFREMSDNGNLPDAVFLLDRGAAPLDPVITFLFQYYCPNATCPRIFHVNIGRSTQSKNGGNRPFKGDPNILRDTFSPDLPTGTKRILILDDYSKSGKTINKALSTFQRAFPDIDVKTKLVFNKIPNWQGNSDYTGLEEYTTVDYIDIALAKLNEEISEHGLYFGTYKEFIKFITNDTVWLSYRFYEILREIEGTIPFARPSANPGLSPSDVEKEMRLLCAEILDRYFP